MTMLALGQDQQGNVMEMRSFGGTGMRFSILGFGCGAVGGLMVRGDPADQERTVARALAAGVEFWCGVLGGGARGGLRGRGVPADQERTVARALEAGVNYFDTAVQYGDGASETNLGRVLKALKPTNAVVGTKVRLKPEELSRIGAAVTASLEGSLKRLGLERVDIFHLHNSIADGAPGASSERQVLDEVVPAFDRLRRDGKLRFPGLTAVGDTAALHRVIDSGAFLSAQVTYNMLNSSAAAPLPANYPAQDYGRLLDHTTKAGTGVVCIRVLAGGALSGSPERHPIASPPPDPTRSAQRH